MANMLDITEDEHFPQWVNLDQVFYVGTHHHGANPVPATDILGQVVLYRDPAGNGLILPDRFTLNQIVDAMKKDLKTVFNQTILTPVKE